MTRFRSQSYSLLRWGIPREPVSTDGSEQTAPGGGSVLVTVPVPSGKTGKAFAVHITATEANYFQVGILVGGTFTTVKDYGLAAEGTIEIVVPLPLVTAAKTLTGSAIQVRNVNAEASGPPSRQTSRPTPTSTRGEAATP